MYGEVFKTVPLKDLGTTLERQANNQIERNDMSPELRHKIAESSYHRTVCEKLETIVHTSGMEA
jgi:hypothetical protein